MTARGDLIGGTFLAPEGAALTSTNPANRQPVHETAYDVSRINLACEAAESASAGWARLTVDERFEHLARFRAAIANNADAMADAISREMGKLRSEAAIEIRALIGRFDVVLGQVRRDFREGALKGFPGEVQRFHPHGVVGVIGPFNFPLHLCHAHAIPALLMGNSVVIKPSELAPLASELYGLAAMEAGLPDGVLNVVQGRGASGAALAAHPAVRGLCFTGSYGVGRKILEATLDRPELLVALEMGGKNTCVVLPDADIRQAAHEIAVGGYLTTGQRCTCTDRVLVHRDVRDELLDALREVTSAISFGDPFDDGNFGGPLASEAQWKRYDALIRRAEESGATAIVAHETFGDGAFATASVHVVDDATTEIDGYTDEEVFGPNVLVQVVDDADEAINVLQRSPYGFANAVFTRDQDAFANLYNSVHAGIWNLNRTTNQASPRLPFGGVGQSGNFRPAGAYAARNVCYPVAMQNRVAGNFAPHPKLVDHLVAPNLDQLAEAHAAEERAELARDILEEPRPLGVTFPADGDLPQSSDLLERFYAGDRIAREKKPNVFDHLRSHGALFASVDRSPLTVLDGMSQTATIPGGFADDAVVDAIVRGEFAATPLVAEDTTLGDNEAAAGFAAVLRNKVPGLQHVTFANSGAEANEKALALCRNAKPDATRVLAFEGSFHGRTLLALHATFNPVKRGPFELQGYEVSFAPFPVWGEPNSPEPEEPEGFLAHVAAGDLGTLATTFGGDDLLQSEITTLLAVNEHLTSAPHFALIIEPMQSEGGDRYGTARFYQALRLLTRRHDVPLIFDEVQTGFGLGGAFAWHQMYGLVDKDGNPDGPDAVTFAKRAQVGVCLSRFDDPEPTNAHSASLVRGRIHAETVSEEHACKVHGWVWPKLLQIAAAFPHLVSSPRSRGYAFAFDLPSSDQLPRYIGQRFYRGAIVYAAGTRTVRHRLSASWGEAEIERLFESIRRSLAWLDAHPSGKCPPWMEDAATHRAYSGSRELAAEYRLRLLESADREVFLPTIVDLEARVYEPARRDPPEKLGQGFGEGGTAVVCEHGSDKDGWTLVGSALACPLELVADVEGPDTDPNRGSGNTLYSLAITVHPEHHGHGIGTALKAAQIRTARDAGYAFVVGRNKVGDADAMTRLNLRFGAHTVAIYDGQYGDPDARSLYYRIPVGRVPLAAPEARSAADVARGLSEQLSAPPASLVDAAGLAVGPTATKITICNFITPAVVRAVEWAGALMPSLPHMYLSSSRDELFDKSVRLFKYHRKAATQVLGVAGGYVGHTTAAARSLSDPAVVAQGPGHFDWPRVPHPADGVDATIAALDAAVADAGGADHVLSFVFEPVQERTGRVWSDEALDALHGWRQRTGVPCVAIETASAHYRSGRGPFYLSGARFRPDVLAWWAGGQTGFMHVAPEWFVSKPLTFVSTWDGDELSMLRLHHQLRAVRSLARADLSALENAFSKLADRGVDVQSAGAYAVLSGDADGIRAAAATAGLTLRELPGGRFSIAPYLDRIEEAAQSITSFAEAL